jgi:ribose 5-phosphate isomerase A
MIVGLGTGQAAKRAITALAGLGLDVDCVATSDASERLARALGLRIVPLDAPVDVVLDGADEVDPALRMIKGRGGAMTREKIVAHASARRIYLIQADKLVARLGATAPLPIEVLRFGLEATRRALRRLGLDGPVRAGASDDGNPIVDVALPATPLAPLAAAIAATPGVVGHGLFLDAADLVRVEDAAGAFARRVR